MSENKFPALIVEDDPNWLFHFNETIGKSKNNIFEFHAVPTLTAAIDYINSNRVEIILLDLMLPDSQGLETITKMVVAAKHRPIVVVSTLADHTIRDQALNMYIENYLVKDEYDERLFYNVCLTALRSALKRTISSCLSDMEKVTLQMRLIEARISNVADRLI